MLKVILNGCNGRMGQVLAAMIRDAEDMKVAAGIDAFQRAAEFPVYLHLAEVSEEADVILDFSHPRSLKDFIPQAIKRGLPAVVATTSLGQEDENYLREAATRIAIFRSANMSLGINLMQALVKEASKILGENFDVEIIEKHHNLKKDAPSGTALMLADSINEVRPSKLRYVFGRSGGEALRQKDELGIHALRGGTLIGEHDVYFTGGDEMFQIGHRAYSRKIFAAGALAAARYLIGRKPGLYNMQDMINERSAVTTLSSFPEEALISLDAFPPDMDSITLLYGALARADVFIDMISHAGGEPGREAGKPLCLSFTTPRQDLPKAEKVLAEIRQGIPGMRVSIEDEVSKISVEGPGMEFQSGVAYRVFSCLARGGIKILAVTTSEIKISCVIARWDLEKAVEILKNEFGLAPA
jgi:4-hydroxy-tetrahydrodipicolinate reductase